MTRQHFADAYQNGYDRTVRFLCSRGIQGESAREMAQAAWVRGWERVSQLRNESLILTWINAIALNCYRSSLRKSPQFEQLPEIPSPSSINLAAIDIEQILDKSAPRDRDLFRKFLQGSTTREIAEEQKVSQTAIRLRFLRARREVRERLQLAA